MLITLLLDNKKSWFYPYAEDLKKKIEEKGNHVYLVHSVDEVEVGDFAFFLSCEKIIKKDIRTKNKYNIVVHSSALPKGKGWSPLTWQILEGKNKITNTLFEAVDKVDAGVIYMQNEMEFCGDELLNELHEIQGRSINQLILEFISLYPLIDGKKQVGDETFYERRTSSSSELNIDKSIKEQFNLLRVVDNELYPAYFLYKGNRYILTIKKEKK
ncbi:MAG: formyltransferase family protein [Candidatus Magasanikbacteria bacterium]